MTSTWAIVAFIIVWVVIFYAVMWRIKTLDRMVPFCLIWVVILLVSLPGAAAPGFVLLAVTWFMVFFVVLPLRLTTQGEAGAVVPGTPSSAPADPQLPRKVRLTTLWAIGIWVIIGGTIASGLITVRDLDWFERMSTPEVSTY